MRRRRVGLVEREPPSPLSWTPGATCAPLPPGSGLIGQKAELPSKEIHNTPVSGRVKEPAHGVRVTLRKSCVLLTSAALNFAYLYARS